MLFTFHLRPMVREKIPEVSVPDYLGKVLVR